MLDTDHEVTTSSKRRQIISQRHCVTCQRNIIFIRCVHIGISKHNNFLSLSWLMTNVMHKFLSMHLFLFVTLYMFRAQSSHHQERQIVSLQPLVTVILRWCPRCVQVGKRLLPTCTHLGHQHRMTVTRGCIDTICLS